MKNQGDTARDNNMNIQGHHINRYSTKQHQRKNGTKDSQTGRPDPWNPPPAPLLFSLAASVPTDCSVHYFSGSAPQPATTHQ
jgi:hypothetical protein